MIPTTWNGYFVVQTEPNSTTFTVNMAADPGSTINFYGKETALLRTTAGCSVKDNIFTYNHDYGIQAGNQADGLMIQGNVVEYSNGVGLQANASYSQIRNNKIHNSALNGLVLTTATAQPLICTDIVGNQVYDNGLVVTSPGIQLTVSGGNPCTDINIEGNHCFDDQAVKTQSNGLKITGSPTRVSVLNNNLANNNIANIQVPSTDGVTVDNNIGVNPRAKSDLGTVTGSPAFDSSLANYFTATLGGNITPTMPANLIDGTIMTMALTQDATGSRTWTSPANAITSGTLTLSTTASVTDTIVWAYNLPLAKWIEVSRSIHDAQYPSIVTTTTNLTMTVANDTVLADSTSGNITVKLPTAVGIAGKVLTVKRINVASANNVILAVASASGQTIDGTATQITIYDQWQCVAVKSNGTNWFEVAAVDNAMTTLGDILYESSNLVPARLAGNTTTTKKYLSQTGNGTISAVPAWAQIAAADLSNGVTGSGSVVLATSPALTGSPTAPTPSANDNSTNIATTAYVDGAITGLDAKDPVAYASTSALPANTYANGSSGVGATLTGNANGFLIIDGITLAITANGLRALVAGEATAANNGWYIITDVGSVITKYVLTRDPASDQAAEIESGYITGVVAPSGLTGGANNGKAFISSAPSPFTVGTSSLTFSQVGSTYSAGTGLSLSGTTFSIDTSVTVDKTTAQTLTNKRVTWRVVSMTDATSITPTGDTADENTQANTQAAGTLTANAPSGTPTDGQKLILRIKCTNAQNWSWNAIYRGSNDVVLPTSTTGSSKTDYLAFIYNNADTKWDLLAKNLGF